MKQDATPDFKVVYIGGYGRSGSTLLDIYIGNHDTFFSLGELMQITRDTIKDEYCSCLAKIGECEFWAPVMKAWEEQRQLSMKKFKAYDDTYRLSLRNGLFHFKAIFKKDKQLAQYHEDYRLLIKLIQEKSQANYLVDSSKNPFRLLLYKRILPKKNIVSIQIYRHCTRVLNSYRKPWKKDIEKGIEKDIAPRKTGKVLRKFVSHHFWTRWLSIGIRRKTVIYERIIVEDDYRDKMMSYIAGKSMKSEVTNMKPGHLIAGNRLRLQQDIVFQGNLLKKGLKGKYVTGKEVFISRTVNALTRLLILS